MRIDTRRKLNEEQVLMARKAYVNPGSTIASLARKNKVSRKTIQRLVSGITYKNYEGF